MGFPDPPLSASPLFDALASRHRVMITPGATAGLTEFLNARLAEDELAIRRHWASEVGTGLGGPFDRARLLYDCVAKRMIVAVHTPSSAAEDQAPAVGVRRYVCAHDHTAYPCLTLRALAIPYADHPEFRPEWRS